MVFWDSWWVIWAVTFTSDSTDGLRNSTVAVGIIFNLVSDQYFISCLMLFNPSFQTPYFCFTLPDCWTLCTVHNVPKPSAAIRDKGNRESFLCDALTWFSFTVVWKRRTWGFVVLQKPVCDKKSQIPTVFCNPDWNVPANLFPSSWFLCPESCWGSCGAFNQAFVIPHEGLSNTRSYQTNEAVLQYEIPVDSLLSADRYLPSASQPPFPD